MSRCAIVSIMNRARLRLVVSAVLVIALAVGVYQLLIPAKKWRFAAPCSAIHFRAQLLPNGKVLIYQAWSDSTEGNGLEETPNAPYMPEQLYDPATNSWSDCDAETKSSFHPTDLQKQFQPYLEEKIPFSSISNPIASPDGRHLYGEWTDSSGHWSGHIYDARTKAWKEIDDPDTVLGQDVLFLPSGRLLVSGGTPNFSEFGLQMVTWTQEHFPRDFATDLFPLMKNQCRIFDIQTMTFRATSPLNVARFQHCAVILADQRVLVIGGVTDKRDSHCEIIDAKDLDP